MNTWLPIYECGCWMLSVNRKDSVDSVDRHPLVAVHEQKSAKLYFNRSISKAIGTNPAVDDPNLALTR